MTLHDSLFGVTPHMPEMTDAQMATLALSGASTVRITTAFILGGGTYNWTTLDRRMGIAARARLRVVMSMGRTVRSGEDFADAAAFAARYKTGGVFWTLNPDLLPVPVTVLAGNEPTWTTAPFQGTEADFAGMVNDIASGVHSTAPRMDVYVGGMQASDNAQDYLGRALRTITKTQIQGCCYHPYRATPRDAFLGVKRFRWLLDSNGMPDHRIMLDECGWRAGDIGEAQQAHYLTDFFQKMRWKRKKWGINRVLWYGYQDDATSSGFDIDMGLRSSGDGAKAAWSAFRRHSLASARINP